MLSLTTVARATGPTSVLDKSVCDAPVRFCACLVQRTSTLQRSILSSISGYAKSQALNPKTLLLILAKWEAKNPGPKS